MESGDRRNQVIFMACRRDGRGVEENRKKHRKSSRRKRGPEIRVEIGG